MPLSTGGEDRSHGADDQRTGGASWDTLQLHDWELWTRKDLCSNQLALWGLQIICWATPLKGVMVSYTGKQRQRPTTTLGVADTADSQGFYRWQTGCVHCQRKSVRNELKFTSIMEKKQKNKIKFKAKTSLTWKDVFIFCKGLSNFAKKRFLFQNKKSTGFFDRQPCKLSPQSNQEPSCLEACLVCERFPSA